MPAFSSGAKEKSIARTKNNIAKMPCLVVLFIPERTPSLLSFLEFFFDDLKSFIALLYHPVVEFAIKNFKKIFKK